MSQSENMKDLVSTLLSKKKRNDFFYDKTDTMSIASFQSSIFDLESSMSSCDLKNLKTKSEDQSKNHSLPFKTRPLNFKGKKNDTWLYSNPRDMTIIERPENPIDWMRTIFDDNNYVGRASKCNLKQQLSKSQGNLFDSIDFDIPDGVGNVSPCVLVSHRSVSDLKNITNLTKDDIYDSRSNMCLSKTAPGSTENVSDTRSSYQDFLALAKQQEDSLKAEVMRRKSEMMKSRSSAVSKAVPSMKYIKNGHLGAPRNRFGYGVEKSADANRGKTTNPIYPRLSVPIDDSSKRAPPRSRYNVRQSYTRPSEHLNTMKVYHI